MTFRVGQKVVCVKEPHKANPRVTQPVVGKVYTVRQTYLSWPDSKPGIVLDEIQNGIHRASGQEYGFYASRFRPVVERKTDISIFTEILRKASKPARGPAVTSPT
jgi:hypothetical protein